MNRLLPLLLAACTAAPMDAADSDAADDSDGGATTFVPPEAWGEDNCAPPPDGVDVGRAIGDQLDSLVLKDCDGNDVAIASTCGATATWMAFAHGWCPHCREIARLQEGIAADYEGLAAVHVLVETNSRGRPTAEDCATWRDLFGHEQVLSLYDPDGRSFSLWDENFTALSVLLDANHIITDKVHTDIEATLRQRLDAIFE